MSRGLGDVYKRQAIGSVLDDVLLGYHCTIFAYGQTGTGKTHTMEGDLSSFMETYAPDAGVIPRALYRLFHVLESRGSDFAVRMSLVELYNEELRDLLSDEPTSLRMYDDPRGRGIMPVSYTHLTLPTTQQLCRSRWSPYH